MLKARVTGKALRKLCAGEAGILALVSTMGLMVDKWIVQIFLIKLLQIQC